MTILNLERGIAAVQQGNLVEGGRLIRIALQDSSIQGAVRSMAWLWLAETVQEQQDKLEYYNQALAADPTNEHAQQRIKLLLGDKLPPAPASTRQPPTSSVPPQPQSIPGQQTMRPPRGVPGVVQSPQIAQQSVYGAQPQTGVGSTVGIVGGPNGRGTGFFISRDGLLATSRFVVGGEEQVTLLVAPGQTRPAQVVRAFPQFDLAFIYTGITPQQLITPINSPQLPPNMSLIALAHDQQPVHGQVRPTRSTLPPEWFPTTIESLTDAGGNPVLNNQQLLVGMLTRNASRTSAYVFGLSIHTIYRCLEHYLQEIQTQSSGLVYCPACGSLSRAANVGAYYCETCGSLLPMARGMQRQPQPQLAEFYGESRHRPCPNCQARVGFFDGVCLRCGHDTAT